MTRVGWLDAASGVSGDMLLGALHELSALAGLPALLESLADLDVSCTTTSTARGGLAATAVHITGGPDQPARRLDDVLAVIAATEAPAAVRDRAGAVFRRLAAAEAAVHGTTVDEVHFHEVGAVDAIVDIVGGCLGLHTLGLDRLVVSPIALGGGMASTKHGPVPVPVPAVLALLAQADLVGVGDSVDVELATPTGVALLAEWATGSGPMPAMRVGAIGVGAGSRDLPDRPNVVRLVVGEASDTGDGWRTIEANVDDLDPRLWPVVIERLLDAGAADAWLTPVLMKKGRPAHVVSALTADASAAAVRAVLFAETSTLGVRETTVAKHALDRAWITVDVGGQEVRVKLGRDGDRVVNVSPEFDDVVAAALALDEPVKEVLGRAAAEARRALGHLG